MPESPPTRLFPPSTQHVAKAHISSGGVSRASRRPRICLMQPSMASESAAYVMSVPAGTGHRGTEGPNRLTVTCTGIIPAHDIPTVKNIFF